MSMSFLLPFFAAGISALSLFILMLALRSRMSSDGNVNTRLDSYVGTQGTTDQNGQDLPAHMLSNRINDAINRQGFAAQVAHNLEQANLQLTVSEYILMRTAVPLVCMIIALVFGRSLLVLPPAALVGLIAPSFWIAGRRRNRHRDFDDQLPETLTTIAGSLRGGFSLVQALSNAAKESPEPTKSEFTRVVQEIQLGLSLPQALNNLLGRIKSADLDLVVTAVRINARVGGNLTPILEGIATTIRERNKLRREVRVITSMQRISSYVIGALPFALGGILFVINPVYMGRLFTPGWTLCIPIGAFISAVVGFVIIQRIVDIKV